MKTLHILTAVSALSLAGLTQAADGVIDLHLDEAKGIVQTFATQLHGGLTAAIEQNGPVQAIGVCQERAPAIAADLSASTGWKVRRTSLKVRNGELNAPGAWEKQVLTNFAQRQADGADVQTLVQAEVVETDGVKQFRFMKAIPTGEVCLACHGTAIAPDVAAALDEHYPHDQARGFSLGEIRGAFSLAKPL